MPRQFFDLSGQTFGYWTVVGERIACRGRTRWPCRCECGAEKAVDSALLRDGSSRGCRKCSGRHKRIDISGQQFGMWTALKFIETRNHASYFLCRCECGVEREVSGTNLKSGQSTRCSRCGHSGDRNGWRQRAIRANSGAPLLHGTLEYATAAACCDRAKKRGLEFGFPTLSACAQWIRDNTPPTCPVFGFPLIRRRVKGGFRNDAPSVDRIDSKKGYTPENMQVISMLANAMKNDATPAQLRQFAEWVLRGL